MREFKAPPENVLEKTIERQWLAPVALLWEESPLKEKDLVPLSEITLPLRVLAVNSLFPGHEDYPHCRETVVTLINTRDDLLLQWFMILKADSQVSPLVWIGVLGDIMPGRGVKEIFRSRANGIDVVFNDTKPLLLTQDLLLDNLEGAVTEHTERIDKNYNFKFSKSILYFLKQAGFDCLSLTNNHSFDMVMVHAGEEYSQTPDAHSKNLYRRLVDSGADVVLGAHPHVLQGMEVYQGKLIVYSLGNFIFPGMNISLYCQWSLLLLLGVYDSRIVYVIPVPVQIDNKTISLDKSGRIARHFSKLTRNLVERP